MEELLEELMPRCDYSTNQSVDELLDELTIKTLPQHSNESSPPFENTERMCVSTNYPQTSQVPEVSVQRNTHHIASERVSTRFANEITQGGDLTV
jgi:division protein CdvB (Snf7/Vps24/ESCRT-III family)